jgi:hypothetical protein
MPFFFWYRQKDNARFGSAKQVMLKRRCSVLSPATQPYIFNNTQDFNHFFAQETFKTVKIVL